MTSLDAVDLHAAPRPATVAPRLRSRLPQIAGVSVLAIGGVVLLGCAIDAPLLQSFVPGAVAMKANTAIGLVLAATALLLHAHATSPASRQTLAAQLCGLLVAALGGATVLEYLLGVDLRIDQLFLAAEAAQDGGPMPGRMAAVTAAALTLIGGALLVPPRRQKHWPRVAQSLALAAGSLALAALLGYAYGAIPAAGSGHGIQIAPHAAIALVVLSVGKLALHADVGWVVTVLSPGAGGVLARRLLPVAFLTPLLLGGLRQLLIGLGWLDIANGAAATAVATMLVFAAVIWRTTSLLDIADRDWHVYERARLRAARAADDSVSVERLARQRAEEARAHAEQVMLARAEVLAQLEIRDAQLTERTRDAELLSAELGAQRRYLRQVLDTIPSFVFIKNMEGEFTLANVATARAYGTTPENLVGKRDIDFSATAEEAAAYRAADRAVAESGRGITLTEPITDATGEVRWLETVKRPIEGVGRDAGHLQVLGVSTDITAYRRAEAALRESESALAACARDREAGALGARPADRSDRERHRATPGFAEGRARAPTDAVPGVPRRRPSR